MIPLETFPLAEWHYGELADIPRVGTAYLGSDHVFRLEGILSGWHYALPTPLPWSVFTLVFGIGL